MQFIGSAWECLCAFIQRGCVVAVYNIVLLFPTTPSSFSFTLFLTGLENSQSIIFSSTFTYVENFYFLTSMVDIYSLLPPKKSCINFSSSFTPKVSLSLWPYSYSNTLRTVSEYKAQARQIPYVGESTPHLYRPGYIKREWESQEE